RVRASNMKNFMAKITVMFKKSVLDPQGAAVERALKSHGYSHIHSVRMGKVIEINLGANSLEEAQKNAATWADTFLANPVMETFTITVEENK
ncbi:MAG: phosphoribosylformylglycinamidine synthase subunit PurS, partial [Candidatus Adiutrix sp.]